MLVSFDSANAPANALLDHYAVLFEMFGNRAIYNKRMGGMYTALVFHG
jgi:hypothetical protein